MAAKEALDRAIAEGVPAFTERGAQFLDGHVRGLLKQRADQLAPRLDAAESVRSSVYG